MTGAATAETRRGAFEPTAWLALAVGDARQHAGNDGYEDEPASHYSWDSTVPNHRGPAAGHVIALWDKRVLLGASVIEAIEEEERTKPVYSCRRCGFASIKARKTVNPRFLCFKCGATFDEPDTKSKPVTTYRSHHDVAWVDLPGTLAGADLRALCERPRSQLSLRPLRFADFRDAVIRQLGSDPLTSVELRAGAVAGGHRTATARIRIGQADFRRRLLDEFGSVCAITGPAPGSALEAGHLYSYSAVGKHHDRGGLLLRRDIHRLFDLGDIAVNPSTMTVDVVPSLLSFPVYAVLAGRPLAVPVAAGHRRWLVDHWREHRLPEPS